MATLNDLKTFVRAKKIAELTAKADRYRAEIKRWTERRDLQPLITDARYVSLLEGYNALLATTEKQIVEVKLNREVA
jgi:hypothetical protein